MRGSGGIRTAEIVPIADRARYMDGLRLLVIGLVLAIGLAAPSAVVVDLAELIYVVGAYAALALTARAVGARWDRVGRLTFGFMLLADGVFLAWSGYATGAAESPVRFAILLHVVAVALLASYRTGLKIALWHSLLLLVVFYAQQDGLLRELGGPGIGIGTPFQRLLEFSGLFWVVAIATAAFSAVNERELRRRRYDTEALAAMATALESASEPRDVGRTLLDALADSYGFESLILVTSREGQSFELLATYGDVEPSPWVAFDPTSSALATACDERGTVLVSTLDAESDPWLATALPGARNVIAVPLTAEGETLGLIVAVQGRRMPSRIARRVVSMVERFVSHGTLALRNAWLLEQVRRMATTDSLTRIANRAAFDNALSAELGRASRLRDDVSLLMLDIDHFKRLNDVHGHQLGDQVLRLVGTTLKHVCRDFDTPARYGGEEFGILLPSTGKEQAMEAAERIRTSISEMPSGLDVTVSVGVATFPFDGADPDTLVGSADKALYASKRNGRNRVTAAETAELTSI
jgi:diguanylate cyclase (GGDEF)-like protein